MTDFTVFGLLGPAGVGKDLVADWFVKKGFVKISFADPMKRFVLRTFDIKSENLWGLSEQRNKTFEVSESWWQQAAANLLEGNVSSEIIYEIVPEGMKTEALFKLFDWFRWLRDTYPTQISARIVLQTLGTEWGRTIDPLMWARYGHKLAQQLNPAIKKTIAIASACWDLRYDSVSGIREITWETTRTMIPYTGVVIPDIRFRNEVLYTQEQGGYVARLHRPEYEKAIEGREIGVKGHVSEAEQKELPDKLFDVIYEFPESIEKATQLLEDTYSLKPWARKWDKTNEFECNIVRCDSIPASKL